METQSLSPLPGERAQNSAARWVLWGYVIISGLGVALHSLIHFVERSPIDWWYLAPTAGIGIAALLAVNRLQYSLSKAMFSFAWSALAFITTLLVYQLADHGNYFSIIPMFHIGIFTLGLILGFLPAIQYATVITSIFIIASLVYKWELGNTVLYIALAYAAALPAKVVEQLIEQSTTELSAINLKLEVLVQERTAALREEIAERKKVEASLRERTIELEKQNAELDAYAHTVAHDLKSPMASLVGFADLLEQRYEKMPAEKTPYFLHIISHNGRKIVNIIDELLLLASVRAAEEVQRIPIDMSRIAMESQRRLADAIAESSAELITPETWLTALGYEPWIEEVLVNYISNAIKYGGSPPRIELGATDMLNGYIRFWVRDNGKGLTTEEQQRLFTPFTQLTSVRAKGHGLGLSIVQRIVKKLNGDVGVESTPGQGSTFFFTLPRVHTGGDTTNIAG